MEVNEPVETKTVKALTLQSLKRTLDLFQGNYGQRIPIDEESQRIKLKCKIADEYAAVRDLPSDFQVGRRTTTALPSTEGSSGLPKIAFPEAIAALQPAGPAKPLKEEKRSDLQRIIEDIPAKSDAAPSSSSSQIVAFQENSKALGKTFENDNNKNTSAALIRRMPSKWPKPEWHAPWKLYRVISGHLGWVRSLAVDPSNEWFCTGSADRTIKIWDLASGQLRLTLTGHIEQVTGLAVSPRHPYMFSCALDKMVKCWDLEYNKVIRHYHGHLSGVYSMALHPTLDVLMTGGRDSVCRVWDMRSKTQAFCLTGHDNTVCSIISQSADPQVITGSHDATIKLWDLATGKTMTTLTHHKKSVRAMCMHPKEFTFASASADNIKKFVLPKGNFLHNMLSNQRTIINSMGVNEDGIMCTGGDNGSLWFWDWKSGHCFQKEQVQVQPGSLESESGVFAMSFDQTGTRLITCEADKTIKMWKEDENATPETHPGISFRPPKDLRRF
mmetsp:Transcript_34688/g.58289  ORF Transcript_34688/g.58289 Transcript_34688/m.58289 type:complete len:499 (-) Transcript_34688:327-1823(-)|eukprot:CAMPEP_0198211234 /NCGR_PEP_ID=MMETSP1445-20131203/22782_1 /TAXON_ID=36898 /ORGANISM="Pyramimonas sp., Strain CCMP2087" /LENGTH=498 /DNA_ID=CAMNT_0043885449 /DNA_START=262 /DNA_END=1758 /DNA_ORIENTATION=-